jgi:hypothetical protein
MQSEPRPLHEVFLAAVHDERVRLRSRRGLLAGSAGLGMVLVAATRSGLAQDATPEAATLPRAGATPEAAAMPEMRGAELAADFENDLDVLNYALTLEHLEHAFYRDGLASFTADQFATAGFDLAVVTNLTAFSNQELAHVEALTGVVADLGGTPVQEAVYDFGDAFTDPTAFLETAQALENTGVAAYDGAGAAISDPALLTTAGTIVAVEGLHAAYLNVLNGEQPAPRPFEEPLSRDEVLEIASQFLPADTATPTG